MKNNELVIYNQSVGVQIVYLDCVWILRNVDKNVFKNVKIKKNDVMICGIYYFITKLYAKIDVIPRNLFIEK